MVDIKDYEGLYAVTEDGKVWSYGRKKWMTQRISNPGYYYVKLSKDGKAKSVTLHRILAQAFIPNPDNLPCVNHKDENKLNNSLDNLEWCTVEYNNNYGTKNSRISEAMKGNQNKSHKVLCVETGEEFISASEASRQVGVCTTYISMCCRGIVDTVKGYHWKFI